MLRTTLAAVVVLSLAAAPAALAQAPRAAPSTNPAAVPAGTYKLDKNHASLAAQVSHFGFSNYTFLMRGLDGSFVYDPKAPTATKVSITIDPASVDSGLPAFDREIGTDPRFFGGQPISFTSRSLAVTQGNKGRLAGDLTLRGLTRPVVLDVTFNGGGTNMRGTPTVGFSATGKIKRSDFAVAGQLPPAVVGDDVTLTIEAEFNKAA